MGEAATTGKGGYRGSVATGKGSQNSRTYQLPKNVRTQAYCDHHGSCDHPDLGLSCNEPYASE